MTNENTAINIQDDMYEMSQEERRAYYRPLAQSLLAWAKGTPPGFFLPVCADADEPNDTEAVLTWVLKQEDLLALPAQQRFIELCSRLQDEVASFSVLLD